MIIKNDASTIVSISYKHCPKIDKWSASSGYGTYQKHLEKSHPYEAGLTKIQSQLSKYANATNNPSNYFIILILEIEMN